MTRVQYAATPTPIAPTTSVINGSVTVEKAGTKSVWLCCRCIAGFTLFSTRVDTSITAGQGLRIGLPAAIKKPASNIADILVVLAENTNPINGIVVATFPGTGTLPAIIDLTKDAHFATTLVDLTVITRANLPTGTDRITGQRRIIDDESLIVEFNGTAWVSCNPQILNPYITNSLGESGCDRDITQIEDESIVLLPDYSAQGGLSNAVDYWLVNDSGAIIPQGSRIKVRTAVDDLPLSPVKPDEGDPLAGLIWLTPLGMVNLTDYTLDATGDSIGQSVSYQSSITQITLDKDLPANSAYVLRVQADFRFFDVYNFLWHKPSSYLLLLIHLGGIYLR